MTLLSILASTRTFAAFEDEVRRLNNVIIRRHRDAFTHAGHPRRRSCPDNHRGRVADASRSSSILVMFYWPNRVSSPAPLNAGIVRLFGLVFCVLHAWSDFIIRQRAPQWNHLPWRTMVLTACMQLAASVVVFNRTANWFHVDCSRAIISVHNGFACNIQHAEWTEMLSWSQTLDFAMFLNTDVGLTVWHSDRTRIGLFICFNFFTL